MSKDALKKIACCGKTLKNNKVARHRHRKAMMNAGVKCPMEKQTAGRTKKYTASAKKVARRKVYAEKKAAEKEARKEQKTHDRHDQSSEVHDALESAAEQKKPNI